ncbi:hypothetical protein [Nonomuraea sp. NPDC049607]|uniref:hypothetical protein n=1 Tax=Nonomuraea sp. NPDC049607 TaxID=3154732 RepID=UPI00342F1F3C
MIAPQAVAPSARSVARRLVLAGAAGIVLTVALVAWAVLMPNLIPSVEARYCGEYTGCIGYLFLTWEYGRWVALVAAWPLLHLLRVRPAWPAALMAALYLVAIWQVALLLMPADFVIGFYLILLSGVIAFPAAAWTTMPHLPRAVRFVTAGVALALYAVTWPLAG